jgi:hypothetical protein
MRKPNEICQALYRAVRAVDAVAESFPDDHPVRRCAAYRQWNEVDREKAWQALQDLDRALEGEPPTPPRSASVPVNKMFSGVLVGGRPTLGGIPLRMRSAPRCQRGTSGKRLLLTVAAVLLGVTVALGVMGFTQRLPLLLVFGTLCAGAAAMCIWLAAAEARP